MVEIYDFDERLNLGALLKLSLTHVLDNLAGIAVNASNFIYY